MELDWDLAAKETTEFGVPCTGDEMRDPNWCFKQLGRMGYSLRITMITKESYLSEIKRIGKVHPESAFAKQFIAEIERYGGLFTYQLQGGEYAERGSHNSPMCESLSQAAAVALYNMARLEHEDKVDAKRSSDSQHS